MRLSNSSIIKVNLQEGGKRRQEEVEQPTISTVESVKQNWSVCGKESVSYFERADLPYKNYKYPKLDLKNTEFEFLQRSPLKKAKSDGGSRGE